MVLVKCDMQNKVICKIVKRSAVWSAIPSATSADSASWSAIWYARCADSANLSANYQSFCNLICNPSKSICKLCLLSKSICESDTASNHSSSRLNQMFWKRVWRNGDWQMYILTNSGPKAAAEIRGCPRMLRRGRRLCARRLCLELFRAKLLDEWRLSWLACALNISILIWRPFPVTIERGNIYTEHPLEKERLGSRAFRRLSIFKLLLHTCNCIPYKDWASKARTVLVISTDMLCVYENWQALTATCTCDNISGVPYIHK